VLREKKLENRNNLLFTFALLQLSRVATSQKIFVLILFCLQSSLLLCLSICRPPHILEKTRYSKRLRVEFSFQRSSPLIRICFTFPGGAEAGQQKSRFFRAAAAT